MNTVLWEFYTTRDFLLTFLLRRSLEDQYTLFCKKIEGALKLMVIL
jgi:hypothetical protein